MRTSTQNFQDLVVWQKAHQLVLQIYKVTKSFPRDEVYGLTSQIRRSSVSVAANIVEGYRKKGKADKMRFMNISEGSVDETKYYIILAKDLEYIKEELYLQLLEQVDEVSRLLLSYIKGIERNM